MVIRLVRPDDAEAIRTIYAPYITDSAISFEYEVPTAEEFRARVERISSFYPYIVAEEEGKIVGYAYAHEDMDRAAYQWNVELSIYLAPEATGKGIGKKLYKILLELLRLQGIKNAYACVAVPNPQSEGLHLSVGFRTVGTFTWTGYKHGAWQNVTWYEKLLGPYDENPQSVKSIHDVSEKDIAEVLQGGKPQDKICF